MSEMVLAAVQTRQASVEVREFPMPDIPPDRALLKVEAAGMCGSYRSFTQELRGGTDPIILGHENAGTLVKVGRLFAERWGVQEGDYVALEEYIPCYHCEWCLQGEYRLCYQVDSFHNPEQSRFGSTPITKTPSLWGGYSQYLYLPMNVAMQPMPRTVRPEVAAFLLPLANGVQWAVYEAGIGPGRSILIQGPGPKGLGCVIAAKLTGAERIIVTGFSSDARRLEVAKALGADHVIDVEQEPLLERVMEYTGGEGVDCAVDCTASTTRDNLWNALDSLKRKGGAMVLPHGLRAPGPGEPPLDFPLTKLSAKYASLHVARGHNHRAVAQAAGWIASGRHNIELVASHQFSLAETAQACLAAGGEGGVTDPVSVTVNPWL